MRVVSLLPSATETLFALGLGDQVVGVTHECDFPDAARERPAVTRDLLPPGLSAAGIDAAVASGIRDAHTIYQLDVAALEALEPDVVVAQDLCDVCAVPTSAVDACSLPAGARVVVADPSDLPELAPSVRALAEAVGAPGAGARLAADLERRLDAVRAAVTPHVGRDGRPDVLVLEWPDPVWTPGHWVPAMVDAAGGRCLLGEPGAPSRRAEADELRGLRPDVVLAAFCGMDLAASRAALPQVGDWWPEVTAAARTVAAVDGSAYFSRPGPRLVDGVELLARLLHPAAADALPDTPPAAVEVLQQV